MAVTADHIFATLTDYLDRHPEEKPALAPALDLLEAGTDLTSRKEFRGHATAGAVLVGPGGDVLYVHHVATGKWLLPGGHLEAVDRTLAEAAGRELAEETGIPADALALVVDVPLHIDVHPFPADPAKGEPDHQHIDFRYLFRTTAEPGALQAEEVAGAEWRPVSTLHDDRLRQRVREAVGSM
ncbi:MAG: NUDIX domain-containing protein [Streptomyces sp.]|nr:NUDIX domain-containing protein [Streptomyces sp.]